MVKKFLTQLGPSSTPCMDHNLAIVIAKIELPAIQFPFIYLLLINIYIFSFSIVTT